MHFCLTHDVERGCGGTPVRGGGRGRVRLLHRFAVCAWVCGRVSRRLGCGCPVGLAGKGDFCGPKPPLPSEKNHPSFFDARKRPLRGLSKGHGAAPLPPSVFPSFAPHGPHDARTRTRHWTFRWGSSSRVWPPRQARAARRWQVAKCRQVAHLMAEKMIFSLPWRGRRATRSRAEQARRP